MSEKIRDADKLIIRVPSGMRDRIKKAADFNSMSMNTLLVMVLENAFPRRHELSNEDIDALVKDLRERLTTAPADEQAEMYQRLQDLLVQRYFEPILGEEE